MVESLERLIGLSKSQEFIPDERMAWDEDEEMYHLHFVSTSGLIKEVNSVAGEFLASFLDENSVSVVVRVEFRHLKPVIVGEPLIVGLRIVSVRENIVTFAAVIMKENERIAEGTIERAVISRNYLRRKAFERS
ncbi:thioesterase family protein [Fervidobacterium thailandense]|uniref:Thioesterase n=1 Tax=Fervidobacterium thailandense TaxID=1008305 RepID=A0A1E3G3Z5_9BACT|nr:hotdog domain-containing protein [Fervidobacterium thailandense]ODN31006.1 thioesterase [Fervidobacterium thailandense]